MTQSELSERSGVDLASLNHIERGKKELTPYTEKKIMSSIRITEEEKNLLYAYHSFLRNKLQYYKSIDKQ